MKRIICFILLITLSYTTVACAKTLKKHRRLKHQTSHSNRIQSIIEDHPDWYMAAKKTEEKWGVPSYVQFAIIEQESNFSGTAKNGSSSAYGFAQAIDKTWRVYQSETRQSASRSNFSAASDFIGWYTTKVSDSLGVSKENAYGIYLAYHDGIGGYKSAIHRPRSKVSRLARTVADKAEAYREILAEGV